MTLAADNGRPPPPVRLRIDWQALATQTALALFLLWLLWNAIGNAADNMRAKNIPTHFDFLGQTAGFDLNQSLIAYSATSTYARAFLVGLLNTLVVAGLGIVFATIIGFIIGIARLSQNWLASRLATVYVEVLRNTPLLLQLLFWYNAVLAPLPGPRQSYAMPALGLQSPDPASVIVAALAAAAATGAFVFARRQMAGSVKRMVGFIVVAIGAVAATLAFLFGGSSIFLPGDSGTLLVGRGAHSFLNSRGLFLPMPLFGQTGAWLAIVLFASLMGATGFTFWARLRQADTGRRLPLAWINAVIILVPAVLVLLAGRGSISVDYPRLSGFNLIGGVRLYPEFFALLLGLSLYTASFIAEIVRAGILAVSKGQSEAAAALGLRRAAALKLVIVPQAMRVIIPPLTNQYLNLTKNSSLAVFIGFPELVHIFLGTVLFQTGAAVQIVSITMAVYLTISLVTALAMNFYNARAALAER